MAKQGDSEQGTGSAPSVEPESAPVADGYQGDGEGQTQVSTGPCDAAFFLSALKPDFLCHM